MAGLILLGTTMFLPVAAQALVVPPPVMRHDNAPAAERDRRIEQSIVCRKDDHIAVTVTNGRFTAIRIDGRDDPEALAMAKNAVGDSNIASLNLNCFAYSAMLAPYDRNRGLLAALTLRYAK